MSFVKKNIINVVVLSIVWSTLINTCSVFAMLKKQEKKYCCGCFSAIQRCFDWVDKPEEKWKRRRSQIKDSTLYRDELDLNGVSVSLRVVYYQMMPFLGEKELCSFIRVSKKCKNIVDSYREAHDYERIKLDDFVKISKYRWGSLKVKARELIEKLGLKGEVKYVRFRGSIRKKEDMGKFLEDIEKELKTLIDQFKYDDKEKECYHDIWSPILDLLDRISLGGVLFVLLSFPDNTFVQNAFCAEVILRVLQGFEGLIKSYKKRYFYRKVFSRDFLLHSESHFKDTLKEVQILKKRLEESAILGEK